MTIKDLQPREVWKHFEALTQVPRPSGHLEKIQQFLLDFGKSINVKTWQDEAGNIIMRKPATPGLEDRKGIVLQAHMDMVPQKTAESTHDFEKDPIDCYVDGDWVRTRGTTLGADNGLGVAAIMAIMEDNTLTHGPLEALITADEETGMFGAAGIDLSELKGRKLLSDYMTDRKFSITKKRNQCVVCNDCALVWVVGERSDNRYRITKDTVRQLVISVC